jgi:hypothetical protein
VLLRRPDPAAWAPLEYAAHVSEAIPWYVERIQKVVREDVPRLTPFDWDWAAVTGRYRERTIERVTADLHRACAALADLAHSITADDLARTAIGSDGTPPHRTRPARASRP